MDDKINLKDDLVAEIKQEPETLDMTPLASIKSILRQALGYDDLTPIDLTKHISVALRSSSGSNAIAEREADSDILRFFASGDYPATSLKVSIVPVQEGTGDPSPENIRPITGWTAVKVYQASEYDEEAEPVLEIALGDEAGTVYGGTLDVVTGVLTVDRAGKEYDGTEEWALVSGETSARRYTVLLPLSPPNDNAILGRQGLVSHGKLSFTAAGVFGQFRLYGTGQFGAFDGEKHFDDLDAFKSWLVAQKTANTPLTVVWPIATPLTFELDPEELSTLIGENNIWADCGPVESITY